MVLTRQHGVLICHFKVVPAVSQEDIEALYARFRTLDRSRRGYLSGQELLNIIPELSINPLKKRVAYFCDGMNFREFVRVLCPYSPKAQREEKLKHVFQVWDVNGDGVVCREDMELVIRQAGGIYLTDEEIEQVIENVMKDAGEGVDREGGLTFSMFCDAMKDARIGLSVHVPSLD